MKFENLPNGAEDAPLTVSSNKVDCPAACASRELKFIGPLCSLHLPNDAIWHPVCSASDDGGEGHAVALSQLQPHYTTIGECLAVVEASSLWVGIPYLIATPRIQDLKKKRHGSLSEFVRSSLVTVPTWALCSYVDDLLLMDCSKGPAPELEIPSPSGLERYGLLAGALALGLLCCLVLLMAGETSWLALVQSISLWSILGVGTWFLTHDKVRYWTFVRLLCAEITRRAGGPSGTSAMPLTPA